MAWRGKGGGIRVVPGWWGRTEPPSFGRDANKHGQSQVQRRGRQYRQYLAAQAGWKQVQQATGAPKSSKETQRWCGHASSVSWKTSIVQLQAPNRHPVLHCTRFSRSQRSSPLLMLLLSPGRSLQRACQSGTGAVKFGRRGTTSTSMAMARTTGIFLRCLRMWIARGATLMRSLLLARLCSGAIASPLPLARILTPLLCSAP